LNARYQRPIFSSVVVLLYQIICKVDGVVMVICKEVNQLLIEMEVQDTYLSYGTV